MNYWWLVWSFAVIGGLVAFRMRKRGGNEAIPRRVMYALLPYSDPAKQPQRQLSARSAILLGSCLVLFMIVYLVFVQSHKASLPHVQQSAA
jgi:hypothetical protein